MNAAHNLLLDVRRAAGAGEDPPAAVAEVGDEGRGAFAAYGWDGTLQGGFVQAELLALNLERAARWLVRRRAPSNLVVSAGPALTPSPSPDCDGRGEFGVRSGRPGPAHVPGTAR